MRMCQEWAKASVSRSPASTASERTKERMLARCCNEHIRAVSTSWARACEPIGFLCERDDANCIGVLNLSIADYDEIRSAPNRFLLLCGHKLAETEVVQGVNGYLVVEAWAAG